MVLVGSTATLYIDGIFRSTLNDVWADPSKRIVFGDDYDAGSSHTVYWDYVKYWRTGGYAPGDELAQVYTYDASGNRTKADSKTFTYDTSTSQIKTMVDGPKTTTFTHNAAGNLTSVSSASDTTTYAWMGDNRLASVSSSSTSAAFTYDAEGKRTSKTIDGTTTKFVYDDIKLIAEKDGSGNITARYFYDDSGKLISMKKNGQSYYFHLNHRGDVVSITNGAQAVVASYSYDPWGNILSSSGSFKDEQPFRYASYYWDKEIGVYYLINRYYDPIIGRFISKDPAGDPEEDDEDPAETNPYAYAANNPVMATDPDGLNPKLKQGDSDPTYVPLIKSMLLLVGRYISGEPNYDAMITNNYGANFGPGLDKAVRAFQGLHGLATHGTVGDWTWAELYRQNGMAASVAAASGQASLPPGGQSLEVAQAQPGNGFASVQFVTSKQINVLGRSRRARVDAYAQIAEAAGVMMNKLHVRHEFTYSGNKVTEESGKADATWLGATGWFLLFLQGDLSSKPLPRKSDYYKASAGFKNNTWLGAPYTNVISIKTRVYGNGKVKAKYTFGIDPKEPGNHWKWEGWKTRTQIY